jgi:putative ABC transport system permease protein
MGIFAFLFALPVGVLQAFIMIFVINKRSFGWTLEWNLTNQFFVEIFALAFVASVLSVCYPIFFTNKVKLSEVLRND